MNKRLTTKQSIFVSHVMSGKTLSGAYRAAYDAGTMNDNSVNVAASRLASEPHVNELLSKLSTEMLADLISRSMKIALDTDHKDSCRERLFLLERIGGFTKPK